MDRTNAERQRRYIAKLKAGGDATTVARLSREVSLLKDYIADLEAAAAQSKPGVTNAAEVAKLQADNDALRQQIIDMKTEMQFWAAVLKKRHGGLSRPVFNLILDCLDPRKKSTSQDLNAALIAFRDLQWHGLPPAMVKITLRTLHPDTRKAVAKTDRDDAYTALHVRRLNLLNNSEMPVQDYHYTVEEWALRRRKKGKPDGKRGQRSIP